MTCLAGLLWLLVFPPEARAVGATNVLQWAFGKTSGNVATPIADTSGFSPAHPALKLINGGHPTYSPDIPTHTRFCTGIGSVRFSGAGAGLSTASSIGASSGQNIVGAAQIRAAGGLTMEVWVKNPSLLSGSVSPAYALIMLGMYCLGVDGNGNVGYFSAGGLNLKTKAPPVAGQWLHLAVVMADPDATCTTYTNVAAYLNGSMIGSGTDTLPWFLTRATCVGSWQYGANNFYQGLVYEPRVTLGALSPDQLTCIPQVVQQLELSAKVDDHTGNAVFTWGLTNGVLESAPTPLGPWTPVVATGLPFWRWTNGTMVSAPAWTGPWSPVAQPASPYAFTNDVGPTASFFHLRLPPQPGDADYPQGPSNLPRHNEKLALIRSTNTYPLVLIGDSITHTLGELFNGYYDVNTNVWNKHFAQRHAINLGMNGFRTQDILWNLENGELEFATSPKVFMVLIGCNNADDRNFPSAHNAQQILAGTKAIVDLIRQRHPTSKVLVLRIFPRGGDDQKNATTVPWAFPASEFTGETCNTAGYLTSLLADDQHVFWLDINDVFLEPGFQQPPPGEPPDWRVNPKMLWDLLHPSAPLCAEAWCEAVEPTLSRLMDDTPR